MKHQCPMCNQVFSQKGHLAAHFNRKRPCKPGDFHGALAKLKDELELTMLAELKAELKKELKAEIKDEIEVLRSENRTLQRAVFLRRECNDTDSTTSSDIIITDINNKDDITNIGLVYLIQPEELLGTNRYKVGCSTKPNISRLKAYKQHSHLLCAYKCTKPFETEARLKAVFAANFSRVAGNEYFQGNEHDLTQAFFSVVGSNVQPNIKDRCDKGVGTTLSSAENPVTDIQEYEVSELM